jgi:hypothetical protein
MKKVQFLIITIVLISSTSYGQSNLPIKDGKVTYTNVINIDSVRKDELFVRAKKWFATTYKSANDVIQMDDKDAGEIVGKGNMQIKYYARNPRISHTITISVKDGKYRYIISDLEYSDIQGDKFNIENFPKAWFGEQKLYDAIDSNVKVIIESIKAAMTSSKKNDDW